MRPEAIPEPSRVSPGMRKSMFQLQNQSRWLHRFEPPRQEAPAPRKRRSGSPPAQRSLSSIVRDYKKAIAKLDDIEAELEEWLAAPLASVDVPQVNPPRPEGTAPNG